MACPFCSTDKLTKHTYLAKCQQYRRAIKAIREKEDRLSNIREKKRTLRARITNLSRSNPKSPKLREFTKELESLERDTHDTEMEMSDFKRFALREAFYLRFNAMHEMAEKQAIIAGFGKYIVDLLDIEPTPPGQPHRRPYNKGLEAAQILADALAALEAWQPAEGIERPTLLQADDNSQSSLAHDSDDESSSSKGKEHPALPARPQQRSSPDHNDAVQTTTGDLKTTEDVQLDLGQLDLYGPPPAYSASTEDQQPFSPRNAYEPAPQTPTPSSSVPPPSDPPGPVHQDKYLQEEEETATFQTPVVAANQPVVGPSPQLIYTQSPQPVHPQVEVAVWNNNNHQSSMASSQSGSGFIYQSNYSSLYRQLSRRQSHAPPQILPYSQFQQQYRVDAGGFRIPPYPTAEEEKQALAERYRNT